MSIQKTSAPVSLRGRMFSRDNRVLKERQILVLKSGIAGVNQSIKNDEEQQRVQDLKPGTELKMFREPDNKYDEWAIALYVTDDDCIGYITRFKNEPIARLMDAGKKFITVVDAPDEAADAIAAKENDERYRRAYTENMTTPISVYLVEMD